MAVGSGSVASNGTGATSEKTYRQNSSRQRGHDASQLHVEVYPGFQEGALDGAGNLALTIARAHRRFSRWADVEVRAVGSAVDVANVGQSPIGEPTRSSCRLFVNRVSLDADSLAS